MIDGPYRRVVAAAQNKIELEPFALPELEATQVLVKTHYSAISPGTELAFLQHRPNTPGHYPFYPGYSACGEIIEIGTAVSGLAVGQRVAFNGRHASHTVIEAERCRRLPEAVDPLDAAVFRLGSIALQGVAKTQIQLGWSVAVLGLGPIGNLAGQIARAAGATHVEGVDPLGWRRELALACGFDAVTARAVESGLAGRFEGVIEATGVPAAANEALEIAGRLGYVCLLGSSRGVSDNVNFYRDVHKKGLTVVGAHDAVRPLSDDHLFYRTQRSDEEAVLKLLAADRIQIRPLIGDVVPASEAPRAYQRLAEREAGLMLVVLDWTGDEWA